jgi:hypothetical protein
MSPRYGVEVDQPGGYSLELTGRGETIIYRSRDLNVDAVVTWANENGSLRPRLYASSLRRSDNGQSIPPEVGEMLLERLATFLGDGDRSVVSIDRSPQPPTGDAIADSISETKGEWTREKQSDGTWALRRKGST